MRRSTDRILTTHAGSLPRPVDLREMLLNVENGQSVDALTDRTRSAVQEVVARQAELGIDVVSDGEMGKISYSTYVKDRLSGFDGDDPGPFPPVELDTFPEFAARRANASTRFVLKRPACNAPVALKDPSAVQTDIRNLQAALGNVPAESAFMTAASPGIIALFHPNAYYATHQEYLQALAAAMQDEYAAIAAAGFTLQIDCPDLAGARRMGRNAGLSQAEFVRSAEENIDVLNAATASIPPEQLRIHVCWGNYEGPHVGDIPLRDIIRVVLKSRAAGIVVEAANPRHAHEWAVFEDLPLPPDKVLIPGVIDTTTNFVEHPDLIAQRLSNYAGVVGRENVIAGTDCGFGSAAAWAIVDARVAWAKLGALVEGAQRASLR